MPSIAAIHSPTLVRAHPVSDRGCTECGTLLPATTSGAIVACEGCAIPLVLTGRGETVTERPLKEQEWIAPGGSLAGYRLGPRLGTGPHGSVFLGRPVDSGQVVAIKLLKKQANQIERERFHRETAGLARSEHPHVVQIHQVGDFDEHPFIIMGLATGNLKQAAKDRGPLPVRYTLEVGLQLVSGLGHLHRIGIIHRDIKPENVLVTGQSPRTGGFEVRLSDLGVAGVGFTGTIGEGMTLFAGTPAYMAPEQFRGHYSAASDVYALGILLLELFTGRPPLTDSQFRDLIAAKQVIPLNDLKAVHRRAGETVARLLARCLDPRPAERPDLPTVEKLLGVAAEPLGLSGAPEGARECAPTVRRPAAPAALPDSAAPAAEETGWQKARSWLRGLPPAWRVAVYALMAVWGSVLTILMATP